MATPVDYERPLPRRRGREVSILRLAVGVVIGFALLAALFVASAMLGNF